jgi:nitroreductase
MSAPDATLAAILELARWAPSGDNTQPWRFEIAGPRHVVVHGHDTREHCVYDLDGHPSQMSLGALLETMAIAASSFRLSTHIHRRQQLPDPHPIFDVHFTKELQLAADPLCDYILQRSVQRRPLRTRALSAAEKSALTAALPPGYRLLWLEGLPLRLAMARLLFRNAKLRLTMPEAYLVHRAVIEWQARYSTDRIPDQALGVDALTARLMRWIMHSWRRVAFFNTWLGGTLAPRLQMDWLPGVACAAHLLIVAERSPHTLDDYVEAGRAMQRLWLSATQQGLQLQPEMTPLIFSRYVRERRTFSATAGMHEQARALAQQGATLIGQPAFDRSVFMCRIGAGTPAAARSTRLPLRDLLLPDTPP